MLCLKKDFSLIRLLVVPSDIPRVCPYLCLSRPTAECKNVIAGHTLLTISSNYYLSYIV
jgi:hypothetical protein